MAPTRERPQTAPIGVPVVGDHTLFRIGLRQPLEQEGLSVVNADTARTALRWSAERAPYVAVIGIKHRATRGREFNPIREPVARQPWSRSH
jgi:DNA-binding NarL/FixJ family response regulator